MSVSVSVNFQKSGLLTFPTKVHPGQDLQQSIHTYACPYQDFHSGKSPKCIGLQQFPCREKFKATKIPEIQAFLLTNITNDPMFILVEIPTCFPIPFGCRVVHGPITDQSTSDILTHLSASSGDFWLTHIQAWSTDQQQQIMASDAAKSIIPSLQKDQLWAASTTSPLTGV